MRSYPTDDEMKELAELKAEPWMVEHLKLNPEYTCWGPGEDYMDSPGKGKGWNSSLEFASWKEFNIGLDELNECVHFYFELERESKKCTKCENGYSKQADLFYKQWYGNAPFDPVAYGAKPLTVDHPDVQAFALRQTERDPGYYGSGPAAVAREAARIFQHWKGAWCHHLIQADVDALVADNRLPEFTRRPRTPEQKAMLEAQRGDPTKSDYWLAEQNGYTPTADEVNAWSLGGLSHDAINCHVVLEARCKREGVPMTCAACEGKAYTYSSPTANMNLILWILHPRKGCSRGVRILNLSQKDAAAARAWLRGAAERNAARFAKVAEL